MTELLIDHVYDGLLHWGSCDSRSDFSSRWLGANPAYYRSVVARGEAVSVQAQVRLAATLKTIGWAYAKSKFPYFQARGAWMLSLYGELWDDLITRVLVEEDEQPS